MVKLLEINHVSLHVESLETSVRFYREVLGLEEIPRPAFSTRGAWFRVAGSQELHLIEGRTEPVRSAVRGSHFALSTSELEDFERTLDGLGVPVLEIIERSDRGRQLFLQDPDGYVLEIFQRA